MESIIKIPPVLHPLYLAIMNLIINDEENQIAYFDLWNDQIDRNEDDQDDLFFDYPACFIEFHPFTAQTLGRNIQAGECIFDILIATEQLNETNSMESIQEVEAGLSYMNTTNTVFKLLQGVKGDNFGTITRINLENEHSGNWLGLRVDTVRFRTRITDRNAMKKYIKKSPSIVVTLHDKK